MDLKSVFWARGGYHVVAPGQAYARKRKLSEELAEVGRTRRRIEELQDELRIRKEFEL